MPRTRSTALLGACLVLTLAWAVPASADPAPTPAQLRAAKARVAAAAGRVEDVQARAEAAAEAYNGAVTRAHAAALASSAAAGRAVAAGALAEAARREADAATRTARVAVTVAQSRRDEQAAAEQQAVGARTDLDNLANGAYRTGGQLTMVAMLMNASGPAELSQGRDLMAVVARNQEHTIRVTLAAKTLATRRAAQASTALAAASAAQGRATAALAHATDLAEAARTSSDQARTAARAAAAGLTEAATARRTAQALVDRAEASLGSARATAASLARAAEAARRAARAVHVPVTDSSAARTAISWALQQVGTPYSWGGGNADGPTYGFAQGAHTKGFDCSGLTLFAYGKAGITLDHYTGSQWRQSPRVARYEDLQPGDLMFFATDTGNEATIHHVSIYLGDGKMVEAPHTGDVVKVSPARRGDFIGGTRPWA